MTFQYHRNGLGQVESDYAFSRHSNVFIAGKCSSRSAGASAQQAADQRALAAASEPADQRASASASANEAGGTLAFAFRRGFIRAG